ncbi:hypothetical protein CEXT_596091 [Caerostris extrusa]|uniref:Uncharacterized protein n=1 Tax=Caerostris extrusa TaxID=172846 RepID=A0AAV4SKM6_CAEEX|nr:hypothetical protein CEXT_596091 [Caerostris extrusa]
MATKRLAFRRVDQKQGGKRVAKVYYRTSRFRAEARFRADLTAFLLFHVSMDNQMKATSAAHTDLSTNKSSSASGMAEKFCSGILISRRERKSRIFE